MCDTRLRKQSSANVHINDFLGECLRDFETLPPKLTVGTLQRLAGHIDRQWLEDDVYDALQTIQTSEAGPDPIDQLIAPALRSIDDFKGCGAVVLRVANSTNSLWHTYENPILDEELGKVSVVVDDTTTVVVDPRSPIVWTADDYRLILLREKLGSGKFDKTTRIAGASIRLSTFSAYPEIPPRYITGILRQFELSQKISSSDDQYTI